MSCIPRTPAALVISEVPLPSVEVPCVVKFQVKITLHVNVCPLRASDLSSAADTAFAAI